MAFEKGDSFFALMVNFVRRFPSLPQCHFASLVFGGGSYLPHFEILQLSSVVALQSSPVWSVRPASIPLKLDANVK